MNKKAGQKRSPVSWLMELAAPPQMGVPVQRTDCPGGGGLLSDAIPDYD